MSDDPETTAAPSGVTAMQPPEPARERSRRPVARCHTLRVPAGIPALTALGEKLARMVLDDQIDERALGSPGTLR